MRLGGAEQYALIRGRDRTAALFVFIHGGPDYSAMPFEAVKELWAERGVLTRLGGVWRKNPPSGPYCFLRFLSVPEFSWPGFFHIARGGNLSMEALNETLFAYDACAQQPVLSVPVILVEGVHDRIQSPRLAKAYLDRLQSPRKELIWFDQSAPMPH